MHPRAVPAIFLSLTLGPCASGAAAAASNPEPPQELYGDLFVQVQMRRVFPDSKVFPDAVARAPPARILADFQERHPGTAAELKQFVVEHFILPAPVDTPPAASAAAPILDHIDQLWGPLTRESSRVEPYGSLLALPYPYVVPGGRFRELYYWDSYFTMLGLAASGRAALMRSMVDNFAFLIDTYGRVPNGTRSYYLSRSQPPFFFAMVALLSPDDAAAADARYLRELRREYAFWMRGARGLAAGAATARVVRLPDGALLNRYWDDRDTPRDESYVEDVELARTTHRPAPEVYRDIRAAAESGWDFSSRWFLNPPDRASIDTTRIVPIDLNALLFGLEKAIEAGCERRGDVRCAEDFHRRARLRHAAIDRYLWDGPTGAYLDYLWPGHLRIRRLSAATLYPLFFGLASPQQASAVAEATRRELLESGGVVTTPLRTGEQWDAPNGWAPLNWIAITGFRRYGDTPLADTIACRWMRTVERVYARSGKLVEKYDVINPGQGVGGEYPLQDGFGWTNGVMRELLVQQPPPCEAAPAEEAR